MRRQARECMGTDPTTASWAILRCALGVLQMSGATAALVLLFQSGFSRAAMIAVLCISMLTTVSVVLFGRRPPCQTNPQNDRPE